MGATANAVFCPWFFSLIRENRSGLLGYPGRPAQTVGGVPPSRSYCQWPIVRACLNEGWSLWEIDRHDLQRLPAPGALPA